MGGSVFGYPQLKRPDHIPYIPQMITSIFLFRSISLNIIFQPLKLLFCVQIPSTDQYLTLNLIDSSYILNKCSTFKVPTNLSLRLHFLHTFISNSPLGALISPSSDLIPSQYLTIAGPPLIDPAPEEIFCIEYFKFSVRCLKLLSSVWTVWLH